MCQPAGLDRRFLSISLFALLGAFTGAVAPRGFAMEPSPVAPNANQPDHLLVDFFESRIRPVLIEHCYECHSNETDDVGGSLWLDSPESMTSGGDSGPALIAGDADGSLLISAIRYESSEMPPSGRLPDNVIDDFEKWIRDGAVDPREPGDPPKKTATHAGIDLDQGREFWAFQPVQHEPVLHWSSGEPSTLRHSRWDAFLDASLAEQGVVANGRASLDSQLRRLTFDLTGLPPDSTTRQAWRADPSERHWSQIVDLLLASPEFAEHWARHEMDIARYADSNGSDFNATHHDAWRYRDYLVRNIADDLPIDQMIRHQIAGDLLPYDSSQQRHDQLVATTFLMLGTKMLSERNKAKLDMDVVDEQIDTVGRAFMGMTLGCARCHDHKFDPIPTEDYYALAGIFRSTRSLEGESQQYVSTWKTTALPADPDLVAAHKLHDANVQSFQKRIDASERELKELKTQRPPLEGIVIDDRDATTKGDWTSSTYIPGFIGEGYSHDNNQNKGQRAISFKTALPSPETSGVSATQASAASKETPGVSPKNPKPKWEIRLWYAPGSTRASKIPAKIRINDQTHELTFSERHSGREVTFVVLGEWEAAHGSEIEVHISNDNTNGYVIADAVQIRMLTEEAAASDDSTKPQPDDTIPAKRAASLTEELKRLKTELAQLKKQSPPPLPHAMAVADRTGDACGDCPVHIRGEVNNLGETVPRGFLQVCGNGPSAIQDHGHPSSGSQAKTSGRLELADWLTDPDHPLTSRVAVNRIWMHLMGEGIVRTVDNFGLRGERPTHPELLDALAIELVRGGWSRKHLVRQIVQTNAYRRSSDVNPDAEVIDAENRLLWRAHRRRLPAEAIRDAMLVISGSLDRSTRSDTMEGYGVLVSSNNANSKAKTGVTLADPKRTIYLPVIRGETPTLLSTLDVADPDLLVGKRPTTNVPAQAFALIGSEEVRQWADATARRLINETAGSQTTSEDDRIETIYQTVLQRSARPSDRALVEAWMNSPAAAKLESDHLRWREWIAALFAGTEFRFLD